MEFYSTNNKSEKVNFETALLNGMASKYGLYMMAKEDIPKFSLAEIESMKKMSYAEIAFKVLNPYIPEIPAKDLECLLNDAYTEEITPKIEKVVGNTNIMWLTQGQTYSFKDYAARFFGRSLNYIIGKQGLKRTVIVATSGDTGGAVADALHGLEAIDVLVFYPKGPISEGQRRQMTTLGKNVYAFEVNGDFDVCQALATNILGDKMLALSVFDDSDRFTSANSISIGRLLPQAVYPFYAFSRTSKNLNRMMASIPSGNFGDMMGTVIAKQMGLPVSQIICSVNENDEFPKFLVTGEYKVNSTEQCPSSAMDVSNPSNLKRLFDFYNGHIYDERSRTGKITREGIIDKMPDMNALRKDIYSVSIDNKSTYEAIKKVYDKYQIILDPHGAVAWEALKIAKFPFENEHQNLSVIYETADPGKFPKDIEKAIGIVPELPAGMKKQAEMPERIYSIESEPEHTPQGLRLSDKQIDEVRSKIVQMFARNKE